MDKTAETFDFIVVGGGGGSMCAALVARACGKTALILEKTRFVGGTTARSGGAMWIPNNQFMHRDGVDDSAEKAFTYLTNVVADSDDARGSTPERRRAYIDIAPQMLDFLIGQGIKFHRYPYWPDYYDDLPGGSQTGRVVVADLFDSNELGPNKPRLRANYIPFPASLEEAMRVPLAKRTLKGVVAVLSVGLRMFTSKLRGKHFVGAGAALQGRMFKRALDVGVDIRTEAPVEALLTDGGGRVVGVRARVGGHVRSFMASDGVLVNAGGFSRNQRMRDKYIPGTRADWSIVCEGDTGEMIEEMIRIGADVAQMDEMIGNQTTHPPEQREVLPQVMCELAKPHSIVVDQSGQRYVREAQSYQQFVHEMFARHKISPAIPSWLIMDSQYVSKYMVSENLPWAAIPKAWLSSGFLKKAQSLQDLARNCGMDPAKLTASVTRFNTFARNGKDEDFHRGDRAYDRFYGDPTHKPSPTLGTIEKGPFFAYQVFPTDIGTSGGTVTDVHARVLRKDGRPIEGLYATGNSTASVMGRAYPGGGACVGPSFVWGFAAARHAMNADLRVFAQDKSGAGTRRSSADRVPQTAATVGGSLSTHHSRR
jgi:3-oxosteroid 1-dehydrogenase